MQLSGLHHVTAITAQASLNLAFYTQVLGLRLVKKTVNQDDVSAYHLFYADAVGSPGTDVTFFDWPYVAQNINGVGSIAEIALRVPGREALAWWAERLTEYGITHSGMVEISGQELVRFSDPEGQSLALVDDAGKPQGAPGGVPEGAPGGVPWEGSPVPASQFITGLNSVKLLVQDLRPTVYLLTNVMGFRQTGEYSADGASNESILVFETGPGGPGTQVQVASRPGLLPGRPGWGGVHHVAFRAPDDEQHLAWRARLAAAGLRVTPVIDRFYFKSIYFREPGGVLFEIATDGPGFAADEDQEHLGERLALPPFLEPHRREIEAQLHPLEEIRN